MPVIEVRAKVEELGKAMDELEVGVVAAIQTAVSQLATAAYSEAIRLAQKKLKSTQRDYIDSLEFQKLGDNIYVITLKGLAANAVEDGWAAFDMKPGLLAGPHAHTTAKGTRVNVVPFRHQPYAKSPASQKVTDLRDAVKNLIGERGLSKIIKDPKTGKPLQGVVARLTDTGIKDLEGLVKIQKTYDKTTQSAYLTFRAVSSKSKPGSWQNPGFAGAHIFPEVEAYIDRELDNILRTLL